MELFANELKGWKDFSTEKSKVVTQRIAFLVELSGTQDEIDNMIDELDGNLECYGRSMSYITFEKAKK